VIKSFSQAESIDDGVIPLMIDRTTGDGRWQTDVLAGGQRRHQVVGLEDEADGGPAQLG